MLSRTDDPVLARERTLLAWQRTSLSFATLAVLVIGGSAHRGEPVLGVATALPLVLFSLVLRQRARRAYERPGGLHALEADPGGVRLVTAGTTASALAAAVLVLAG